MIDLAAMRGEPGAVAGPADGKVAGETIGALAEGGEAAGGGDGVPAEGCSDLEGCSGLAGDSGLALSLRVLSEREAMAIGPGDAADAAGDGTGGDAPVVPLASAAAA